MSKKKAKRVIALGDLHSGHFVGLTPPDYQINFTREGGTWRDKVAQIQRECWTWYEKTIEALQPIDIVIANADMIDGRGERSGGTELITTDRNRQVQMAVDGLLITKAKHFVLTYGTPYHTGTLEDFEDVVCDKLKATKGVRSARIGAHEWVDVNGCMFDCKHAIGTSTIPHGRYTALAKDQLWNELWAAHDEQPKGDVIIRSHVHYHGFCGQAGWLAMTLPALQAMGSKFGARKCSGRVDFGLVQFDVNSNGGYTWEPHIAKIERQKARAVIL